MNLIKNKKILLVGLGRLGGGVATAKFLVENGAKLTVTDLNSKKELKKSIDKLKNFNIKYTLGEHKEEDFINNDIIIFNQVVSVNSKWVKIAQKNKKQIETDLSLMLKILEKERPQMEYIAITGTRGKTTITTWAHHFLKPAYIGGNIPELAPLKVLEKILKNYQRSLGVPQDDGEGSHSEQSEESWNKPLVLEIPSYQFEYFELNKKLNPHTKRASALKARGFNIARSGVGVKAPKVAVITNLYVDHLNRHGTFENYAKAKAQIFANQAKNDFLVLNNDIDSGLFLKQKPKSQIFYVSVKKLPIDKNGLYFKGDKIFFQKDNKKEFIIELGNFSSHQKYNLLSALLAAYLWGKSWDKLIGKTGFLPEIKFRQEIILKTKKITIVNDSAATSPEATIAAIERFVKYCHIEFSSVSKMKKNRFRNKFGMTLAKPCKNLILITGGTDKQLDFKNLAKEIKKNILPENLYLLNGSATQKLIIELEKIKSSNPSAGWRIKKGQKELQIFENLDDIISAIKKRKNINLIVFSPGAASFEKFKNEFDRGQKFDKLIKVSFK